MSDNYEGDLAVLVGGRNHFIAVEDLIRKKELNGEDPALVVTEDDLIAVMMARNVDRDARGAAMSGDIVFRASPAEVDAEVDDQNDSEAQVLTGTVTGAVAAAGGGDLKVTVTARGMTNSPKEVTVAVAHADDADDIAGKIRTALAADADVSDTGSAHFTVTGADAEVILTANTAAPADYDMSVVIDVNDVESAEDNPVDLTYVIDPYGKAHTRLVFIYLETADGDSHQWFSGDVAVTIADTAGGGTAHLMATTLTAVGGVAEATIYLSGTWAENDTNTLSVAQATILGYTVTAVTSEETSIDTP